MPFLLSLALGVVVALITAAFVNSFMGSNFESWTANSWIGLISSILTVVAAQVLVGYETHQYFVVWVAFACVLIPAVLMALCWPYVRPRIKKCSPIDPREYVREDEQRFNKR